MSNQQKQDDDKLSISLSVEQLAIIGEALLNYTLFLRKTECSIAADNQRVGNQEAAQIMVNIEHRIDVTVGILREATVALRAWSIAQGEMTEEEAQSIERESEKRARSILPPPPLRH